MPVSLGPAYVAPEIYITSSPAAAAYQRPVDYLAFPQVLSTDDKSVFLVAVRDTGSPTQLALKFTANSGTITYDWGDGSAAEEVASGTQAVHDYDYADLDADSLTVGGFRQAICVVTATTGNITVADVAETPPGYAGAYFTNPFIEWVASHPSLTTLTTSATAASLCKRVEIVNNGSVSSYSSKFSGWRTLKELVLNANGVTTFYELAYNCQSLEVFTPTNYSSVTDWTRALRGTAVSVVTLPGSTGAQGLSQFLLGVYTAERVEIDCSSVTVTGIFSNTTLPIKSLLLTGIKVSVDISNMMLDAPAIETFCAACGTPAGAVTLTTTGNPGALTASYAALHANWTVVSS